MAALEKALDTIDDAQKTATDAAHAHDVPIEEIGGADRFTGIAAILGDAHRRLDLALHEPDGPSVSELRGVEARIGIVDDYLAGRLWDESADVGEAIREIRSLVDAAARALLAELAALASVQV